MKDKQQAAMNTPARPPSFEGAFWSVTIGWNAKQAHKEPYFTRID